MSPEVVIESVRDGERARQAVPELASLLIDAVDSGAGVSFMAPLSREDAERFWQGVADDVGRGAKRLVMASRADGLAGCVVLQLALPQNQPHRAEIAKLLVHRRARRTGLGEALMHAVENEARRCGKSLLVLDTASGDADRLYRRLGWVAAGVIPDYALWPKGGLSDTVVFWKRV